MKTMMFGGAKYPQTTDRIIARKNNHLYTLFAFLIKGQ
jgi:hypothetical protein